MLRPSRRGAPTMRAMAMSEHAACVMLVKPTTWERHGLKSWIEAAKKRMHHNVLAIALANKLARIALAVLNKECNFEGSRTNAMEPRPA